MGIWETVLPGLVSVAPNLLAADAARRAQEDANAMNKDINNDNVRYQREFAQHGVRWKVEDAKAAGIHPLYALGANTTSFSPASIGVEADMSQANMYQNMGQDISRAIQATRTENERKLTNLQIQSLEADVQGKALDNQIRLSQLNKMSGTQVGPALPSPIDAPVVKGQNPGYGVKKFEAYASDPGRPAKEAGAINDYQFARTEGGYVPVPSSDVTDRIEDKFIPETMWAVRNQLMPNFGGGPQPPNPKEFPLPQRAYERGARQWKWHHFHQEFRPHTGKYFVD